MKLSWILLMCALLAVGVAGAAETRDPEQHFFNPNTGDLKAGLVDARSTGKKAIFVFYDLAGTEVIRIVGPVKDVDEFLLLGHFVATGAYKSQKFAEFKQRRLERKGG